MENSIPIDKLGAMDIIDLKALRKETNKRIHNLKVKDSLRIGVYISADIRVNIDAAVKWAYNKKHIKRPSYWSFAKFCINNTVLYIMSEIAKEEAEKARMATTIPPGFDIAAHQGEQIPTEPPKSA